MTLVTFCRTNGFYNCAIRRILVFPLSRASSFHQQKTRSVGVQYPASTCSFSVPEKLGTEMNKQNTINHTECMLSFLKSQHALAIRSARRGGILIPGEMVRDSTSHGRFLETFVSERCELVKLKQQDTHGQTDAQYSSGPPVGKRWPVLR